MTKIAKTLMQLVLYGGFAVFVGYLSASPAYEYASSTHSSVKLSLSHAADRIAPCVQLTPKEIAELAPNMRQTQRCERERLPLSVELEVDGTIMIRVDVPPSGLWNDGPASVYKRFELPPGRHRISARLRDTARADGWDFNHTEDVDLEAGRYFTVTFKAATGGFRFR